MDCPECGHDMTFIEDGLDAGTYQEGTWYCENCGYDEPDEVPTG